VAEGACKLRIRRSLLVVARHAREPVEQRRERFVVPR
jgi:hypothetical protein